MCLIAFAHRVHPEYPLILIANRDEFYKRPARPAQFWVEEGFPDILAGKDLTAGGTWIGIHKNGRWAALTNYRDLNNIKENAISRGDLVLNYLKSDGEAFDYLNQIKKSTDQYNGFNLLVGNKQHIFHYSNHNNQITEVQPGIHALSNALLNTPWTKVCGILADFESKIKKNQIDVQSLLLPLMDKSKADDKDLPETGLTYEMEKAISSRFIVTPDYGTRCSSIIKIDEDGQIYFYEQSYQTGTSEITNKQEFIF